MSNIVTGISSSAVHFEQGNVQNELPTKLPCLCEICIQTTYPMISILNSNNSFRLSRTSMGQWIILMATFPVNIT